MTDKNKKLLLIAIPVAVVVIAALIVGAIFLFGNANDTYRTIKVYRVEGGAEVQKAAGDVLPPYENMLLQNNDSVKTLEDGYLYLKLDEDKYLLAEPGASFSLIATGDAQNSKTRIEIAYGAVTVHVTKALSGDSSFEIGTGNSTMAVRGTSFRVSATTDEQGNTTSTLEVFEGQVSVQPTQPDGSAGQPTDVSAGQAAVVNENGEVEKTAEGVVLEDLDDNTLEFLKVAIENGKDIGVSAEELDQILANRQKTFTVTFVFEGRVFATERVAYGELATRPTLMPAPQGNWEFDFATPITEDVTINWVE